MALRISLQCHPDTPCEALDGIEVEVARQGGRLSMHFTAGGNLEAIRIPAAEIEPQRKDELWLHTCFEAFVRLGVERGYYEFNFAPGGWAAYGFDDYRQGMADLDIAGPNIEMERGLDLRVSLELPDETTALDWRVGLSAVIEETNGGKSYWALRHPPGKADFHHPDSFALELPGSDT